MIKKKICLLGSFSVGKSSLIRKYVLNVFSDTYLSTVGVKIDKKELILEDGTEVTLMIWDLEGRDDFEHVAETYLRGMSAFFLVADGTRPITVDNARRTYDKISNLFPGIPSIFLLNKKDMVDDWKAYDADCSYFADRGVEVLRTSAKTGDGVEAAFLMIAAKMVACQNA